jgi:hypothetical protein
MLHCVSLDDTDIYEENVELGLLEWMKPHPSSKVIRKVMKDTFALRRQWILTESPPVGIVLQKFPPLKTSKYVSM